MIIRRRQLAAVALSAAVVLASGCQRQQQEAGSSEQQQESSVPFTITEILARPAGVPEDAGLRPAAPKDVIEVVVHAKGRANGSSLSTKMIDLANGSPVGIKTVALNAANASSSSVRFEPNPAWSPGRFLFEISLDGKLVGTQELEIFPADVVDAK